MNVKWTPDNLRKLSKTLKHAPAIYGLPMFHLYYSVKRKERGIMNRMSETTPYKERLLHAFRIIVGLTWNWTMANIAGYETDVKDLNKSITGHLCKYANKDEKKSWKWNEIVDVKSTDFNYHHIMNLRNEILDLSEIEDIEDRVETLRDMFENKLSQYGIQDEALVTLVPLPIQKEYRDLYGDKALKAFRTDKQEHFSCCYDITRDIYAFLIMLPEDTIRHSLLLSNKTVQRDIKHLTEKYGYRSSKAKHGRRQQQLTTPNCSLRSQSGDL